MNLRFVIQQFGLLLLVLSALLLLLAGVFFLTELTLAHQVSSTARLALFESGLLGLLAGGVLWLVARKSSRVLGRREALLLVAMTWLLGAAFAGLPYFLWAQFEFGIRGDHPFNNLADCYFEAMSGLTTTGATVLGGNHPIVDVPRSLLLWRAFTQWIGGLGIVVLFVAVLPTLGVGGKRLFLVEAPGPAPEGLQPQIRQTARVLLLIYVGLTVAQIAALLATGLNFFDALCHTFTTLATGGFSTRDASVGAYGLAARIVFIVFMFLAGANFSLYFALIRRRYKSVWRDPELRTYAILLAVASALIGASLLNQSITTTAGETLEPSVGAAASEGVFTAVSIATTTGFCTSDYNGWPFLAQAVLVILMFIGGSAGSTAGGLKVIRIWIAFKVMLSEIEHVFRPQVVRPVRVGNSIIDTDMKLGTIAYVLGFILLFAAGAGAVMLVEQCWGDAGCTFTTASTASLASLCTIGPGLGAVGAVENYGWMTWGSKLLLSLLMALGRLEVFAIIVLFTPRFWRGD